MKPLQTLERLSNAGCDLAESVANTLIESSSIAKHLAQTGNIHSLKLLGETWAENEEAAKTGMSVSKSLDAMRRSDESAAN